MTKEALLTAWRQSIGDIPFSIRNKETDTEWGWKLEDKTLYLAFCGSVSALDWKQNFSFWAKPYKNMPDKWFAHSGFVTKWKSIRDDVLNLGVIGLAEYIAIRGYSQGAAIGLLAHEDFKFNFPDKEVSSVLFGCPRVVWLKAPKERFSNIDRVTNGGDIVTGLPPWWFGYKHLGCEIRIGKVKKFRLSVKDHLIKSITKELIE